MTFPLARVRRLLPVAAAAALVSLWASGLPAVDRYDQVARFVDRETFAGFDPVHQQMLITASGNSQVTDPIAVCWEEGSDLGLVSAFEAVWAQPDDPQYFQFSDGARWSNTATDGPGLGQGDPTVLTWSIVPDGTPIFGFNGEPSNPSDFIAFMDGLYGAGPGGSDLTQRPWFTLIEQSFESWSDWIGTSYVYEPNDDGVSLASTGGSLGVRGDVRIGGHLIDGNSGTLAYNFFPNNGDMVIDTADNFYNDLSTNSRKLRNVVAHEHGHGLGISHVCPVNQTKLMEPTITASFDGPQSDDLLAGQRGYGDRFEFPLENDASGDASDLGFRAHGSVLLVSQLSVDDNSDEDFFTFEVPANTKARVRCTPAGSFAYLSGPQNANGSCSAGTLYDPKTRVDLGFEVLGLNGSTVLATVDNQPAGGVEDIIDLPLSEGPGNYYVRFYGDGTNDIQGYFFQLFINEINVAPTAVCQNVVVNGDSANCEVDVTPAEVDNGSSDPNGDTLTLTLEPAGPYAEGVTAVDLIVTDTGGLSDTCQATITVTCSAGPMLAVSPASVFFSSVALGDTACQVVTVKNDGDQNLDVFSVAGCDTGEFFVDTSGLTTPVAPGDSTQFSICFSPTGGGADSCQVTVSTNDGDAVIPVSVGSVTAVGNEPSAARLTLGPVFPNPFTTAAEVRFVLSEEASVRLEVFDFQGRRVATLLRSTRPAGEHRVQWDGRDARGATAPSGIYFLRLSAAGGETQVTRMVRTR